MENPKIRFKGFTKDWEQRKLGELVGIYDGVHQTPDYQDSGIMFLSVENIATLKSEKYISEAAFERDYKVYPEKGDILMTRIGDVGTTNVVETAEKVAFYVSLALLKPNGIDSYFLSNAMKTNPFLKGLRERTLVTAIPQKINKDEIGKIDIFITNNDEEQKKIGAYFHNLDNLITLHQRKCEQTKNLKKYMLQKMFPQNGAKVPEIRFDGFTYDWEQRKFSDIASRESVSRESSYDLPSLEYEDVIAEEGRLNKDISLKENIKKGIVFDGSQVLYGKLRPYLHNWLNPDFSGVAVGDWWVLKPNNADKSFIYRLIQTQRFDDIANQSAGSKMPRADWNLVSNTEFAVPVSQEEQEKIGEYFSSLDHLITLHQRKCDELKKMKKYMLQNMFI
ncbi:restriction endonuclease subunit S [Agathobacter rectalis]|uniref:Restriction endonuclease subunit S n=1 Tax=Agathobacter rectalis TaxID=39491 RepID=A0A412RE13_9FIRM|nr:restriction endonuclease subunit S [Agathobacter rectalis]RGU19274.1 restriction endonuclease subunit S [Agathobacter rectalis]